MEISRDKTTETEGTTSIRLRYSRQFQNGGHAHTIDAEATLAIGAGLEKREQVIRELEAGVELLARQITQRSSRSTSEGQTQVPARSGAPSGRSAEPPPPPAAQSTPRPATASTAQPGASLPVSESMPATPTTSGERRVTLPDFLQAIKKRWDMSADEAKELLHVNSLTGLNYREVFATLRALKEAGNPSNAGPAPTRTRAPQSQPTAEAMRQTQRTTPNPLTPAPDTTPISREQTAATLKHETQPSPRAAQVAPSTPQIITTAPESGPKTTTKERDSRPDFASSSKAPLPIQLGVVRDASPRSYSFEEEEEEYELPDNEGNNMHLRAGEAKLAELKNTRADKAVSPERLNVLNNLVDSQISEEQLDLLIKLAWNLTGKKRLRAQQVEALISWAKEDYFVDEVEALLAQVDEEEN